MEPHPDVASDFDEEALLRDAAIAERNQSMRERGRQIAGMPGAVMAGMMIALRDIYEVPKRDNGSVVVDSPSEPHDVDRDGLDFDAAEVGGNADVAIDAQLRRPPIVARRRGRPRWRSS